MAEAITLKPNLLSYTTIRDVFTGLLLGKFGMLIASAHAHDECTIITIISYDLELGTNIKIPAATSQLNYTSQKSFL